MAGENTSVVIEQGGTVLRVKSGGKIIADAGGTIDGSAGKVISSALKTLKGVGAAAPGAVTLTGAAVGDIVRSIFGNLTAGGPLLVFVPGTDFEAVISVTNQIQQLTATDLHLDTIVVQLA